MTRVQMEAWKRVPLVVNMQPDISEVGNAAVQDLAIARGLLAALGQRHPRRADPDRRAREPSALAGRGDGGRLLPPVPHGRPAVPRGRARASTSSTTRSCTRSTWARTTGRCGRRPRTSQRYQESHPDGLRRAAPPHRVPGAAVLGLAAQAAGHRRAGGGARQRRRGRGARHPARRRGDARRKGARGRRDRRRPSARRGAAAGVAACCRRASPARRCGCGRRSRRAACGGPVRWACAQPLEANGALAVRLKRHDEADWRKGV